MPNNTKTELVRNRCIIERFYEVYGCYNYNNMLYVTAFSYYLVHISYDNFLR